MSLALLGLLVVIGVSLVVGLVHLSGGSRGVEFRDNDVVKQRFAIDFPDFKPSSIVISSDHQVALLLGDGGDDTGLVVVMGAHSLTRMLNAASIKSLERRAKFIEIELDDMTMPKVVFTCGNEAWHC
jgi:hypothetical protein